MGVRGCSTSNLSIANIDASLIEELSNDLRAATLGLGLSLSDEDSRPTRATSTELLLIRGDTSRRRLKKFERECSIKRPARCIRLLASLDARFRVPIAPTLGSRGR